MEPIDIGGQTAHGEPYKPLPMIRIDDQVVTCWRLSWRERLAILFRGVLWHYQIAPMSIQPVYMSTEPEHKGDNDDSK